MESRELKTLLLHLINFHLLNENSGGNYRTMYGSKNSRRPTLKPEVNNLKKAFKEEYGLPKGAPDTHTLIFLRFELEKLNEEWFDAIKDAFGLDIPSKKEINHIVHNLISNKESRLEELKEELKDPNNKRKGIIESAIYNSRNKIKKYKEIYDERDLLGMVRIYQKHYRILL